MAFSIPKKRSPVYAELVHQFGETAAEIFWTEYEKRLPARIHQAILDQTAVSKANADAAHRGVDGIGQCTMRWAPSFKLMVGELFGIESAADEDFLKTIERDNCYVKFKPTYQRKATITR